MKIIIVEDDLMVVNVIKKLIIDLQDVKIVGVASEVNEAKKTNRIYYI